MLVGRITHETLAAGTFLGHASDTNSEALPVATRLRSVRSEIPVDERAVQSPYDPPGNADLVVHADERQTTCCAVRQHITDLLDAVTLDLGRPAHAARLYLMQTVPGKHAVLQKGLLPWWGSRRAEI